jgi:hypothetical protein
VRDQLARRGEDEGGVEQLAERPALADTAGDQPRAGVAGDVGEFSHQLTVERHGRPPQLDVALFVGPGLGAEQVQLRIHDQVGARSARDHVGAEGGQIRADGHRPGLNRRNRERSGQLAPPVVNDAGEQNRSC